jgi:RHS repeat-associated protein
MTMPGRQYNGGDYRYGFNGMEKDAEVNEVGNSYTAEFWQYDSRLGRRWNVDPVMKFDISLYCSFANNPIIFIDPNGDDHYFGAQGQYLGSDGVVDENGEEKLKLVNYGGTRELMDAYRKERNGGWGFYEDKIITLKVDESEIQAGLNNLYKKSTEEIDMVLNSTWEHVGVIVIDANEGKIRFIETDVNVRKYHGSDFSFTPYSNGGVIISTQEGDFPVLLFVHTHQGEEDNSRMTLTGSIDRQVEVTLTASEIDQTAANTTNRNAIAIGKSSIYTAYPETDTNSEKKPISTLSKKDLKVIKTLINEAIETIQKL